MGKLYIGTSGYNYQDWQGIFYPKNLPKGEWLSFYSRQFDTIEINATFYRSFPKKVFENWYKKTNDRFTFSIKGSRFVTHIKRIKEVGRELDNFFNEASGLREKLSVVLWQFPGSFKLNRERKERLRKFSDLLPKKIRQTFEFRDKSWFEDEIFDLLSQRKMGFVINDSSVFPKAEVMASDFAYFRFHGPGILYASSYSGRELKIWAAKIKKYLRRGDVYCYFNNDAQGFAVKNARTLRNILSAK